MSLIHLLRWGLCLWALDCFALVVKVSLSDLTNGHYRSKMQPTAAIQSLLAFSIRYRLPIFFCENRGGIIYVLKDMDLLPDRIIPERKSIKGETDLVKS